METDGLGPNDSPAFWGEQLIGTDKNIMLVGHLPYLPDLISYLFDARAIVSFEAGTVICIAQNEIDKWKFLWQVNPSKL